MKKCTFFSALCCWDNIFLLSRKYFCPNLVILHFLCRSLSSLFKVQKRISWSLDTAVQRLLVQKRNTDDLLLGNKLRTEFYFMSIIESLMPLHAAGPEQFIKASARNLKNAEMTFQDHSSWFQICPTTLYSVTPECASNQNTLKHVFGELQARPIVASTVCML